MKKVNIILLFLLALQCSDKHTKIITVIDPIQINSSETVRNGIDVLIEDYPDFLNGKAVGLVTNHTGITRREKKNYEVFKENSNFTLKKIFAPEHGFFGEAGVPACAHAGSAGTGAACG